MLIKKEKEKELNKLLTKVNGKHEDIFDSLWMLEMEKNRIKV